MRTVEELLEQAIANVDDDSNLRAKALMAFVGTADEELLLEYGTFVRVDHAVDAFRSTVELLSDISPRGVKQKFAF